jgi:hypothetical protein
MLMTLGSNSIVFIDASIMVCKNTSTGRGLLRVAAFASSSASEFLFLSMYSMVKPLNFFSHSSYQSQIFLEGWFPSYAFFFYLSGNHFGICVKDAPLNPNGP